MYIKLEEFSGISPRTGPTLLAPNQAQRANNLKLQSGELRPWRAPVAVYTPGQSGVQSIYQMADVASSNTAWLEWTSADVDAVPGPVADSTDTRLYYTGDSVPKKTNWALATTSGAGVKPFPNAWLNMGVPAPTAAPTLAGTAGSDETRVYVYTYVSTFGLVKEESAPSPPATISIAAGAAVTVSAFATAPNTAAHYNVTAIRIYRSASSATSALFLLVDEITVTPSTGAVVSGTSLNGVSYTSGTGYVDSRTAAQLGLSLPSMYYTPPPSGLRGLVAMPNGILAGFVGNQVWFCEPYLPHAWPTAYSMSVQFPIVGLGVFGQTLVVTTTGNPYLISGTTPGAMTQERLPMPEPCISKRSIASDQYGVMYASPNGLVSISGGAQDVISRSLMTKDEWLPYAPNTLVGTIYQNMYLGFCAPVAGGYTTLVLTRGDNPPLVTLDTAAIAVFVSRSSSNVYFLSASDNKIYQLDADTANNLTFEYISKKFVLPHPANFSAYKVQADWPYLAATDAYNAQVAAINASNAALFSGPLGGDVDDAAVNSMALNGSLLVTPPALAASRSIQVGVSCDDVTVFSDGVTNQEMHRMPAASKGYVYQITLSGTAPVRRFVMAESAQELRGL